MRPDQLFDMGLLESMSNDAFLAWWRKDIDEQEARYAWRLREDRHKNRIPMSALGFCILSWGWRMQREIRRPDLEPEDAVRLLLHRVRGNAVGELLPKIWLHAMETDPRWRDYYGWREGDEFIQTESWVSTDDPFPMGGFSDVIVRVRNGVPYDLFEIKAPNITYPADPYAHYQYQIGGYAHCLEQAGKGPQRSIIWIAAPPTGCVPYLADPIMFRDYMKLISGVDPLMKILRQDDPPTIEQISKLPGADAAWQCQRCDWKKVCREHFGVLGGETEAYSTGKEAGIADECAILHHVLKNTEKKMQDAKHRLHIANPTQQSIKTELVDIHYQRHKGGAKHPVIRPTRKLVSSQS